MEELRIDMRKQTPEQIELGVKRCPALFQTQPHHALY